MKSNLIRILRGALVGVLLLTAARAADVNEQQAWTDFYAWLQQQKDLGSPSGWDQYRQKLIASGQTPAAADATIAAVKKALPEHRAEVGRIWFARLYNDPNQTHFALQPNAFLVSTVKELKPGRALEVAAGQGRNAVFLAQAGWEVTAFDVSEEGLAVARRNAGAAASRLATVVSRYEDFDYGVEQWDLITFIYTDAPVRDPAYVARVIKSLKPGGRLVLERPHRSLETVDPDLGPVQAEDLPNALLKAWGDLRILHYEDTVGISDWRQTRVERQNFPMRILRLLAKKQPPTT
jgi:SAM-dependent methyltransferase